MNRFLKVYKFRLFIVVILIANGIVTLLDVMPYWWRQGYYYIMSIWLGTTLSFGLAIAVVILMILDNKRR